MFPWTLAVGTLSLLQTQNVHAAGVIPALARRIPGLRVGRDLPVIPTTCEADCEPFAPFLTGATCPVTECCSTGFQTGYADCFICVGNATDATDFTIAQEYVDVLTTSCIAEGVALSAITLPGQNPNRALFSSLPPGASTIPVFPAEGSAVRPSASTTETRSSLTTAPQSSLTMASQSSLTIASQSSLTIASQSSLTVAPQSSSTTVSRSSSSLTLTGITTQSLSLPQSAASSQSTATAPPSSAIQSPSASATPALNAGVRVTSGPAVGLGFAAALALLL
ncbi:hypothetical protein K438DRAFT_1752331 [Mycena galopus ATCC 62051]|nr:hypothetical protein K438DRAFT_1752331 [Mycena galopus ATCC 62051]